MEPPGHGPVHLLVESASSLGFQWCLDGFVGTGLDCLSCL